MGLFDFFSTEKDDDNKSERTRRKLRQPEPAVFVNEQKNETNKQELPMQIRKPRSFEDVEEIIDRFKQKMTVIVYVNELNNATALRVIDILSGAIYALGGGMAELERDMYIFTPEGVNAK